MFELTFSFWKGLVIVFLFCFNVSISNMFQITSLLISMSKGIMWDFSLGVDLEVCCCCCCSKKLVFNFCKVKVPATLVVCWNILIKKDCLYYQL